MLLHQTLSSTPISSQGQHCAVCGEQILEGEHIFVGMIDNGMLVNVGHCCSIILHTVFSRRQCGLSTEST